MVVDLPASRPATPEAAARSPIVRSAGWLLFAVACVTLTSLAAAGGSLLSSHPQRWRPRLLNPVVPSNPTPVHGSRASSSTAHPRAATSYWHIPHWVLVAGFVLALVLVTAVLAVGAARLLRSSVLRAVVPLVTPSQAAEPSTPGPVRHEELSAQVDAAADALYDETDPRAGVIACWLRLEQAAAGAGVTRKASETSAELVHRVMSAYAVDGAALARLNQLFQVARFAPRPVDESDRRAAGDALASVREQLHGATRVSGATS